MVDKGCNANCGRIPEGHHWLRAVALSALLLLSVGGACQLVVCMPPRLAAPTGCTRLQAAPCARLLPTAQGAGRAGCSLRWVASRRWPKAAELTSCVRRIVSCGITVFVKSIILSRNGFQDLSWKSEAYSWKFVRACVRACVRAYVRTFIHL